MTLTRSDTVVVALGFLLVSSLYWGFWRADESAAELVIFVNGEKAYILDLFEDKKITVKGSVGDSLIEIKNGQARFISSPCNTSFCVRSGWQMHGGDFAACLPNSVSLHLSGGTKVYDAINF